MNAEQLNQMLAFSVDKITEEQFDDCLNNLEGLCQWWLKPALLKRYGYPFQTPILQTVPGACWILLCLERQREDSVFRPAVVLPLRWEKSRQHDSRLPSGLVTLAEKILDQQLGGKTQRGIWKLQCNIGNAPKFQDALANDVQWESAWAALYVGLELAILGFSPNPQILATGAWQFANPRGIKPVQGISSKTITAKEFGASVLFVPEFSDKPQIDCIELKSLPAGQTHPFDAVKLFFESQKGTQQEIPVPWFGNQPNRLHYEHVHSLEDYLKDNEVHYSNQLLGYGNFFFPIHIYVGGDGKTRYKRNDIVSEIDMNSMFQLPEQIAEIYPEFIAEKEQLMISQNRNFHNGDQVRLNGATWGAPEIKNAHETENKPLSLRFGWTKYFYTHATNFAMLEVLKNHQTIGEYFGSDIDEFASLSSDPFTTNLSVITSDGFIIVKPRSSRNAGNPGGIQPAVSGSGSRADVNEETNTYHPFDTAIREAREEVTGDYEPQESGLIFFGLARLWLTRFPFLFGELRLDITLAQLEQEIQQAETRWEGGQIIAIPFEIEKVTEWIKNKICREDSVVRYATTYFSLIQSLLYEYNSDADRKKITQGLQI